MWKLVLTDEELHYLHRLLTEATAQSIKFPHSPERVAHETILEKDPRRAARSRQQGPAEEAMTTSPPHVSPQDRPPRRKVAMAYRKAREIAHAVE